MFQLVYLEITNFKLEDDCTADVLYIHDGLSAADPKIGSEGYCGSLQNFALYSSNNTLTLHLKTNNATSARGFEFIVDFIGKQFAGFTL